MNIIKEKKEQKNRPKNINDFIQCIWYCVNSSKIDSSEINALTELRNNEDHIPLIVVFTNATKQNEVDSMKNQIQSLFPDGKFIHVLGREASCVKSFGLDDLLNLTLFSIKSMEKNDIFQQIKELYMKKEKDYIQEEISKLKKNIINTLITEFIDNFISVRNEKDFEQKMN